MGSEVPAATYIEGSCLVNGRDAGGFASVRAMSLSKLLRLWAQEQSTKEAIVSNDRRICYGEFDEKVDRLATGLLRSGISRGDRIAVWLPNHVEYLFVYLACLRIGAVFVPINTRLGETEVAYILENCSASLLFFEKGFADQDYLQSSLRLRSNTPSMKGVVVIGPGERDDAIRFADLLSDRDSHALSEREETVGSEDLALIMYTSGTTGRAKGATVRHQALDVYGESALAVGLFRSDDRVLVAVPLATAAGSVIQTVPVLRAGATLVLMETFKAVTSLEVIEAERITCYASPPTIYILQLNVPDFARYDVSSLQRLLIGAAPVPAKLAERISTTILAKLINSYGATETGGLVTYIPHGAPREKVIETSGKVIPGFEIRIVDEKRQPVGTTGEIAVRGGAVTTGYYQDERQTAEAVDGEGWWYSGDLGSLDRDGYLKLEGRKKEMYIRGGFNIYPAEVEGLCRSIRRY